MINIAHRGANRLALENSFKAFDLAIEGGSQRLEFDIRKCVDGSFVVMHDSDLIRTTGHAGRPHSMTRLEIERLVLIDGQPIPFLDDLISKYGSRVQLNIEMKDNHEKSGERLGSQLSILEAEVQNNIIVSSFHLKPLLGVRKSNESLKVACLVGGNTNLSDLGTWQILNFVNALDAKIVHPYTGLVNENFMDQAKSRSWKVFSYSGLKDIENKNSNQLWKRLKLLGVDGHCTNYPREFNAWMKT